MTAKDCPTFFIQGDNMEREFQIDPELTLAQNFNQWYMLDCSEREGWGEEPLDRLYAVQLFSKTYGVAAIDVQDSMEQEIKRFQFMG
jgi:hypothetical protein